MTSIKARNMQGDVLAVLLNRGALFILDETEAVLAMLPFATFLPTIDGIFNALCIAMPALADGQAAKYEAREEDGTSAVLSGSVGLYDSGADMEVRTLKFVQGVMVSVEEFSHEVGA